VAWTFLPQFRKQFRTPVNEETLITYFIHMIKSYEIKLFLNSYWSTFSSFQFKNSIESFIISAFASHARMPFLSLVSSVTFYRYIRIGVPPARVSGRDGVRLRRVRQVHRGGCAPPHAWPPILHHHHLHHRQEAAQRLKGHCSALRGDLPLRGTSPSGSHLTDCPPWWTEGFPNPHPGDDDDGRSSSGTRPRNSARICLDGAHGGNIVSSFQEEILSIFSWCRANEFVMDVSSIFGPGVEVVTTPPSGTFYLELEYSERCLQW
jgi:hypothetical protein